MVGLGVLQGIIGRLLDKEEAYFVVMPPGALPGPLPPGRVLVGAPYDVTASSVGDLPLGPQ